MRRSERCQVLDQAVHRVLLCPGVAGRVVAVADAGVDRFQTGRRRGQDSVWDQAGFGQLVGALLQWRVDDVVSTYDYVLPRGQGDLSELRPLRHAADRFHELRP
jgi:hypothetical protein